MSDEKSKKYETSNRVSKIAGKYVGLSVSEFLLLVQNEPNDVWEDVQSLAGSALKQDETKGER